MGKKVISNTFTVNTIEDGTFPQQIFYRNQNNQAPATPATSQSDSVPSGWSATPQGVGGVYKYEWVSMRIKTNGVWGVYSTPALYAYLAEDGTSISIKYYEKVFKHYNTYTDFHNEYPNPRTALELYDCVLIDDCTGYSETTVDEEQIIGQAKPTILIFISSPDLTFSMKVPNEGDSCLDTETYNLWLPNATVWANLGRIKGDKGDDAVMYVLEPSIPQFNTDKERTKTQTCTIRAYKIEGKTKSAFTGCFEIDSVVPDGQIQPDSTYQSGNYVSFGTNKTNNATAYAVSLWDKDPQYVTVDEPEPVLLASINIPIAFDGAQGVQGKIGRFFYFGGVFDAADETQTFKVNDVQAPYFEHSETVTTQSGTTIIKRYHVFNYDTNGTYTMAQMWQIRDNWNSKPWEVMTDDFKYIITQALFADFAKLGSWIFSGDYMLSQTGVDGTTNYQNFTGESGAWQPNLYMNALTGRLVGNNVNLRGVFSSKDEAMMNEIVIDALQGSIKMFGPSAITYGPNTPAPRAYPVALFDAELTSRASADYGDQTTRELMLRIGDAEYDHIEMESNTYISGSCMSFGEYNVEQIRQWPNQQWPEFLNLGSNLYDDNSVDNVIIAFGGYSGSMNEYKKIEISTVGIRLRTTDFNGTSTTVKSKTWDELLS